MTQKAVYVARYPRDNALNAWGDYHYLRAEFVRYKESGPAKRKRFTLVGPNKVRRLTQTEFRQCCETYFFRKAMR